MVIIGCLRRLFNTNKKQIR